VFYKEAYLHGGQVIAGKQDILWMQRKGLLFGTLGEPICDGRYGPETKG
jgi:hypothetical protein